MSFPAITGPQAPEEYPFHLNLGEELVLRQVSATEVGVYYYSYGVLAFTLSAEPAHDAEGATVPTTLEETGDAQVTLDVHHREGNPAGRRSTTRSSVAGVGRAASRRWS